MILITGLSGTSGSAFYDVLCREGYSEKIRVITRGRKDCSIFDNSPLNIEIVHGDICDLDFLVSAMSGCDKVFHIANKEKSEIVAEAILRSPQVRYVIMVSSTIVYSQYYTNSKLKKIEPIIKEKFQRQGINYVFIRPTMIFGTPTDSNVSTFIRWFKKYPVFPIVKNGSATIRPVARLDLAEAYWLILKNIQNLSKDEYVVSGKDEMTLIEMFNIITDVLGHNVRFVNVPFALAKFLVDSLYFASLKKIDYREKLDRLTENRAYAHDDIKKEFGFAPLSFKERVTPLVRRIQAE